MADRVEIYKYKTVKAAQGTLKERRERQQQMDVVILEKLTPEDHLLSKVEPANVHDITPMPEIPEGIERRLGTLPKYMGLDAGYRGVWIEHSGKPGNSGSNRIPAAYAQGKDLREIPIPIQRGV